MLRFLSFTVILLFLGLYTCAQTEKPARGHLRIMFYNAENLFDTQDDSLKNDDEFLPEGKKYWTSRKYYKKLNNIGKVITAVGGWEAPEIVGLCEIENFFVLDGVLRYGVLKNQKYEIIHYESPDMRGIDVAMLYRPDKFTLLYSEPIRIDFPFGRSKATRDILYVKGTAHNDTLHFFVNHWPSRWGGQLESEERRIHVARILRHRIDSLNQATPHAKIIIMGDLNDYPHNTSIEKTLQAHGQYNNLQNNELYNLAVHLQKKGFWTHKHECQGGILDQIIVSGTLLNSSTKLSTTLNDVHVFDAPFLLEDDPNCPNPRTFRTYIGYKFHDGFSDHLPTYIDLHLK